MSGASTSAPERMPIIFGLGNPGPEYQNSRHNIGFMTVRRLAERSHAEIADFRFRCYTGKAIIAGQPVLLAMPQTYMNACGPSLKGLMNELAVAPTNAMVVFDDFHLDLGKIRIRRKGSSGGHRGIESILDAIGTDRFPRLKLGIGHYGDVDPVDFVLQDFANTETASVDAAIDMALHAITVWVSEGMDAAMNRFN